MNNHFAHVDYPNRHSGVERLGRAAGALDGLRKNWDTARGIAAVLLGAMVATMVVVADQMMATWAQGHLLAAWVLLWVIGFAALAVLAPAARQLATRLILPFDAWSQRVARRRADARLWELAKKDPRVMADLQAARSRHER